MNGINPPEDDQGSFAPSEPSVPPAPSAPPVPPVPPAPAPPSDPFGSTPPPPQTPPSDPFGSAQPSAPQPPMPGAPSTGPVVPPPYSPYAATGYPTGGKPKLHWGFFFLGFFTPLLASMVLGGVMNLISLAAPGAFVTPMVGALVPLLELGLLVAAFVSWIRGRNTGNNRLRSYGLGMLWAYIAMVLVGLLAFGSCLLIGIQP